MQVTELRIAGFKSFVDPQTVPIEPGLTGIVGPNGCGKSNLLEALRWAMGANSARAMRGDEMDDLIFNGTADRAARETAEVTLVLDNTDRKAPPEFNASDTLEIVRRLKRGMGSSYKLNGRTVRGKDVHLLFADASTGANSPSLVRQGQISELINSKPQNRRRILEEAAGIAGLNSRRHDAELKLNAAEANLQRLAEISAELERQLASLKRQAAKARRYRRLSEELQALEALGAHLRWVDARTSVEDVRAFLKTSSIESERLTVEDASAERARLEAGDGLEPLREAESVASARLGQARIAFARLEAERDAALEAESRLAAEAHRLMEDLTREQAAQDEAESALAHATVELGQLPALNQAEDDELEARVRTELEAVRARLLAREAEADAASAHVSDLRARRRAAEESAAAQARRKAQLTAEIERHRKDLASLEAAADLADRLQKAHAEESRAEIALHDAERAVEAADEALTAAREAEASAHAPYAEADSAVRSLLAEIAGLQNLLRKAEGPKAPPVIERIRTHDGFEKAVAAALGDDLEASTDRRSALYWNGADVVRLTLPEGAEPLTAYVSAPGELAARLALCGLVAAEHGARLATQLQPGQRLVSREGHMWRWDGFVRTPEAPVSAAARLEHQARLEAAEMDVAANREAFEAAEAALHEARLQRAQAEDALRDLRAQVVPAQRALNDARRAVAEATAHAERNGLRRDTSGEALARAESDLAAIADALALLSPDTGAPGTEAEQEARLAEAREAVAAARAAEIEARGQLTDLTRGREQAAARRAGLERDIATFTTRLTGARQRLDQLVARRAAAAQEAIAAKEKPLALARQLAEASDEVAARETDRQKAADELAIRQAAQRDAEFAARRASQAAAEAREKLAAARVKLEVAESRLTEATDNALSRFQRAPEGLLALAEAGLDGEALGEFSRADIETRIDTVRRERDGLGGVNMTADEEATELESRLGLQISERDDLTAAIAKLRQGVQTLNAEGRERLTEAFEQVNTHFRALFTALFQGGQAELKLIEAEDPLNAGLEIFAQPPGKRLGTLGLMSGGEQALTATALIFAVFLSRPAPICVLDEVDAPLDDANVDRFCNLLEEMRRRTATRFIIITHNPVTMSRMDRLFGVTMREKGVSKLVSVDLEGAERLVAAE